MTRAENFLMEVLWKASKGNNLGENCRMEMILGIWGNVLWWWNVWVLFGVIRKWRPSYWALFWNYSELWKHLLSYKIFQHSQTVPQKFSITQQFYDIHMRLNSLIFSTFTSVIYPQNFLSHNLDQQFFHHSFFGMPFVDLWNSKIKYKNSRHYIKKSTILNGKSALTKAVEQKALHTIFPLLNHNCSLLCSLYSSLFSFKCTSWVR